VTASAANVVGVFGARRLRAPAALGEPWPLASCSRAGGASTLIASVAPDDEEEEEEEDEDEEEDKEEEAVADEDEPDATRPGGAAK
jgi:hypothetical protein